MRNMVVFASAILSVALGIASAFAAETKMQGTMSMMKHAEIVAVMPDGHMGTMKMDEKMMDMVSKMATPLDHCVMMMTDKAGKVSMVDTSSPEAMKECEKIAR